MSTPGLPDYKRPPKRLIESARAERARRKACHGSWQECSDQCPKEAS